MPLTVTGYASHWLLLTKVSFKTTPESKSARQKADKSETEYNFEHTAQSNIAMSHRGQQ